MIDFTDSTIPAEKKDHAAASLVKTRLLLKKQVQNDKDRESLAKFDNETREKLIPYQAFLDRTKRAPFQGYREAKQKVRLNKFESNLGNFANLLSDDSFDKELERRGILEKFNEKAESSGDREFLKESYRRKAFTKALTGRTDEAAEAFIAKNLFGDSKLVGRNYMDGVRSYVSKHKQEAEYADLAQEGAIQAFLEDRRGASLVAAAEAHKGHSEKAGKAFWRSSEHLREKFGEMLPLVNQIIQEAQHSGGLDVDAPDSTNLSKVAQLYQDGRRNDFLWLLNRSLQWKSQEVPDVGTRFSESFQRGFEGLAKGLSLKALRLNLSDSEEQLKKSEVRIPEGVSINSAIVHGNLNGNFAGKKLEGAELQKAKDALKRYDAAHKVLIDLRNIKDAASKIPMETALQKMAYLPARALPYMALVPSGPGAVMGALALQEEVAMSIRERDPNVSMDHALWVGTPIAAAQIAIERLQVMTLAGRMPWLSGVLKPLSGGGLIKRAIITTGAEFTQETVQESLEPLMVDISNVINEELSAEHWKEYHATHADRFFAVLPLSLISAGGQSFAGQVPEAELKTIFTDKKQMAIAGYDLAEQEEIATLAEKNPYAAAELAREVYGDKPKEVREAMGREVMDDMIEEAQSQEESSTPVMIPSGDGYKVVYGGDRVSEPVATPEEGVALIQDWEREDFLNNTEEVKRLMGHFMETAEGDNTAKVVDSITLKDLRDQGIDTEENLKKAVAVYHQQMNEQVPGSIDLRNYREDGSVKLRRKMAGYAVRIAKKSDTVTPLTVAEEFSEGFLQLIVGQGETTYENVKTLLDEFGSFAGIEMTQGYDTDPKRAVIEGFSKFAKAYLLQGKYDVLPEESQSWMAKAWRILENPDSMPKGLRPYVEFFTKLLRAVFEVAKAIEVARIDGGGLNRDLESLAQRALGLDEKAIMERMREKVEQEILEDLYDPSEELSQQVKGKLPHPADLEGDPLQGEVQDIWDSMVKETRRRRKDGKKVLSNAKARNFFAKKGEGEALDDLRRNLNEEGFNFATPAEMLGAIADSVEGDKQFPVGFSDEIGNYSESPNGSTFSIAPNGAYEEGGWWHHATDNELKGGKLKRFSGGTDSDMGGIFLVDDSESGKKYASRYGATMYRARINLSPDEVFNLGNTEHRKRVEPIELYDAVGRDFLRTALEAEREGTLDWSVVEPELLEAAGFKGAILYERPADIDGGSPVRSIAVFDENAITDLEKAPSSTFSISPAQDAAYLSAVESGDMDTAQEMVDEAAKAAGTISFDEDYSTYSSLIRGVEDGDIVIHARSLEGVDLGDLQYGLAPEFGETLQGTEAAATAEEFGIEPAELVFASDEFGWAEKREGMIFLRKDEFQKSLGDGRVELPNGDIVSYEFSPIADFEEPSLKGEPFGVESNDWYSNKVAEVVGASPYSFKSADPVTYDESGNVIPLSERFNEQDDRITYSISPANQSETMEGAIDRLFAGPSGLVDTGRKLRSKISKIREKYEKARFGKGFQDEDTREMDTLNALMQLNAIASVLPKEVRASVGSPVPLVQLKTQKAREKNLIKRLDKVSLALDKHLQKELRELIRKKLNKSGFKVSDSRRRKGKIGKIGHEVVDKIREIMTKDLDSAEAEKNRLTKVFEELESPQGEDFERWDSLTMAAELFYDYENATTQRLEQALEFVTMNYKEGRKEWLTKLKQRKEERDQFVAEAISFMGDSDRVAIRDLTKAQNKSKKAGDRVAEGVHEYLFSNHHTLARIVENAKDKKKAREWYNRLLDSRIQGDLKADQEAHEKQQAFFDKIAEVIGAKGATKGHDVRKWLYNAKKSKRNRITTLEGSSTKQVSVDKHIVQNILDGEIAGNPSDAFSKADLDALSKAWERFEELTEKEQAKVRKVKFKRVVAVGERMPVGEISHEEALQWWLTMRQPDQREKLESMGWDERTVEELEEFIPDDVKEVGLWMSNDLVADGKALSDIHAEEFGIGLNTGENYFPVRNRVVDQPVEMDMNDPGAGRTISPGSLKERVTNRARPAQVSAFGTYFQHVTEMAYWKHNVGWVRQYGGAMRTKAFAENMEAKVGTGSLRNLQKYLMAVQNRGVNAGRQMMGLERFMKSLLSRVSLSVLGARVSTMWINATAFVNAFASPDVSATAVLKNMFKMAFDSKGELKATWRNELAEQRRNYGASFEAQMAMKSGQAGHWLIQDAEKLAQKGLIPMNTIDVAANTLTMAAIYRAHYDAAIKRGDTEESARAEADTGVTRAQATLAQPTLAVSRSQAEMATSQNPFLGIFTMFMSEVRKNAANNYVAYRTLLTGKGVVDRKTAARQAAVYTLVYTGVVQAFRGLYKALTSDDEEDEKIEKQLQDPKFWTYAIASDNLAPVPILGDAALSLMAGPLDQKYWEQRTPFTRVSGEVKQFGSIFTDNEETDSAKIDEVIDQMQAWGSVLPGGPVVAEAANLAEFAKKVAEDGYGYSFSESDRVTKTRKEIESNKADIYEKHEDQETRWELLEDVAKQYKEENPDLWGKVHAELTEKKSLPKRILKELE